jgi:hypothetical protein
VKQEETMAKKINVINEMRSRILSQAMIDLEILAERMSKNTTYNKRELHGMLLLAADEMKNALKTGETVKINGLVNLKPNLKVGGEVDIIVRADRGMEAELNNPQLWTVDKISNPANLYKSAEELIALWNLTHPNDPVTD